MNPKHKEAHENADFCLVEKIKGIDTAKLSELHAVFRYEAVYGRTNLPFLDWLSKLTQTDLTKLKLKGTNK